MHAKASWVVSVVSVASTMVVLACSSGDTGTSSAPAFTNLADTRWNQTDTASGATSCNIGLGVTDTFVLHVLAQSGTITCEDNGCTVPVSVSATKM